MKDEDYVYWICLRCSTPYVEKKRTDEEGPFFHYFDIDDPQGGPLKIQVQHELVKC